MELTFDQIHKYFETRLPGQRIPRKNRVPAKCIFHDDKSPSMTIFMDGNGAFNCNGCGAKGNLFQFESRFSGCSIADAELKIAEITGAKPNVKNQIGKLVATYDYRDANNIPIYRKRKYIDDSGKKTFRQFKSDGNGGWISGLEGVEKVLYNLPNVITSNMVLCAEGEADADRISTLYDEMPNIRTASTTSFDGASKPGSKWLESYNPYFTGKMVVIFEDNDDPGRVHAQNVAENIKKYAYRIKIVKFPDLNEHGDVSDFLETHSKEDLIARIKASPDWKPTEQLESPKKVFVTIPEFNANCSEDIDWAIRGVIQRGANGFIVASPKSG